MADYNSEFTGDEIDAGITAANTALQSISGTTDEIGVSGSTISLAAAAKASLALADTATQPADIANMLESDATGITGASAVTNVVSISQADYNSLTPDASTFYIITG